MLCSCFSIWCVNTCDPSFFPIAPRQPVNSSGDEIGKALASVRLSSLANPPPSPPVSSYRIGFVKPDLFFIVFYWIPSMFRSILRTNTVTTSPLLLPLRGPLRASQVRSRSISMRPVYCSWNIFTVTTNGWIIIYPSIWPKDKVVSIHWLFKAMFDKSIRLYISSLCFGPFV